MQRYVRLAIHFACGALVWLVASVALTGCSCRSSRMPTAHFIVPVGFRGAFMITDHVASGAVPLRAAGRVVYEVPANGVLQVQGEGPFTNWQSMTAEWSDGTRLLTEHDVDNLAIDDPKGAIILRGLVNDAKGTYWMHVGTYAEYIAALSPQQAIDRRPGSVKP